MGAACRQLARRRRRLCPEQHTPYVGSPCCGWLRHRRPPGRWECRPALGLRGAGAGARVCTPPAMNSTGQPAQADRACLTRPNPAPPAQAAGTHIAAPPRRRGPFLPQSRPLPLPRWPSSQQHLTRLPPAKMVVEAVAAAKAKAEAKALKKAAKDAAKAEAKMAKSAVRWGRAARGGAAALHARRRRQS